MLLEAWPYFLFKKNLVKTIFHVQKWSYESRFVFYVFFNPKLKQTKVQQVELNRLNDRGKKQDTSVLPLQKGVERDKDKNKNRITNIR